MGKRGKMEGLLTGSFHLRPEKGDDSVEIRIERNGIAIGDRFFQVECGNPEGEFPFFSENGKIVPFYFARTKEKIQIWIHGRVYSFERIKPGAPMRSHEQAPSSGEIRAAMPGKILKILGKGGDRVEVNQPLVVMESMKMEMTLAAPFSGIVESVQCKPDDLVEMGQLLLKMKNR